MSAKRKGAPIREVLYESGARLVGNGPGYLRFHPDGSVALPNFKMRTVWYERDKVLLNKRKVNGKSLIDGQGYLSPLVAQWERISFESPESLKSRTEGILQMLVEAIESGNKEIALAQVRLISGIELKARERAAALKTIGEYLIEPDDGVADRILDRFISPLKAARVLKKHREKHVARVLKAMKDPPKNLDDASQYPRGLTGWMQQKLYGVGLDKTEPLSERFLSCLSITARELQRAPYRKEIMDKMFALYPESGVERTLITKLSTKLGYQWLPSKPRW